ncbi:MAG: geranylgeranylglyceryl/heptaprenylglyceryl phosphate synthase, partial [Bacteroidales bacterium]|nr:geranylgeranylglyceryl/heptaprenylglyceryl phosphate synthase [Bacteroidales bacterium]
MIQRALINFDRKTKSFAWLLDPDQYHPAQAPRIAALAEELKIDFLFVGGSLVFHISDELIREIKKITRIPIILFPGSVNQVSNEADAILMLSLISGRNPEYLIGNHVIAAPFIRASDLEVIPTGYMLVDGGHPSA